MPSEASPRRRGEQDRRDWTIADLLSVVRIPLAVAFPLVSNGWRFAVLATAAASDLLDGQLARRFGSDDSPRFVNGVLSAVAAEARPQG